MSYWYRDYYIPDRMMPGLLRYIDLGEAPGEFLAAVIRNDLAGAVERADEENMENLPAFVAYLYNEAPMACWGSPERFDKWIGRFKQLEPSAPPAETM